MIERRASPAWINTAFCASTACAFFSARWAKALTDPRSCSNAASTLCTPSSASPCVKARTFRPSTLALSCSSTNALSLPSKACVTDLAKRCDCISDCPVAASCLAERSACCSTQPATRASSNTPSASMVSRRRWCVAAGAGPSKGSSMLPCSSVKSSIRSVSWTLCRVSAVSVCWLESSVAAAATASFFSPDLRRKILPTCWIKDMLVLEESMDQMRMLKNSGVWTRWCNCSTCHTAPALSA